MTPKQLHAIQDRYVARYVSGLFSGRKGHGNSVGITRRVLRRSELERIVRDAYQRGIHDTLMRSRRSGT